MMDKFYSPNKPIKTNGSSWSDADGFRFEPKLKDIWGLIAMDMKMDTLIVWCSKRLRPN